jgi:3D (Asp-Asp-Asp) domain-containing protein
MSKPLLGGGAAAAVLLSATFLFYAAEPSVAETLADASQTTDQREQKQSDAVKTNEQTSASSGSEATNREQPAAAEIDNTSGSGAKPATETESEEAAPAIQFTATAYSLRGRTASGQMVRRGVIAADRRVLPIGTRVRLQAGQYSGEYVVADTGGAVKGRKIDIWVPSTREAMRFGRRAVKLTVLTRVRPRAATPRKDR